MAAIAIAAQLALYLPAAHVARADASSSSHAPTARALKSRGDVAMDSGAYADALTSYRDAYAVNHDASLLYNMGRAYERLGQYPEALAYLEHFARVATPELKMRVPHLAVLVAEVRSHLSELRVHTRVPGARVLVRGKWMATTPFDYALHVVPGPATIELYADGYAPYRKELVLVQGRPTAIDASLELSPSTGASLPATLTVRSAAKDGEVCIDRSCMGPAPVVMPLAAGVHTIVVRAPGHADAETSTTLTPGQSKEIFVDARPLPTAVTSQWWFWAGVGVVVLGGVAITAAMLTSKPESSGGAASPAPAPAHAAAPLLRF